MTVNKRNSQEPTQVRMCSSIKRNTDCLASLARVGEIQVNYLLFGHKPSYLPNITLTDFNTLYPMGTKSLFLLKSDWFSTLEEYYKDFYSQPQSAKVSDKLSLSYR